MISGYQVHPLFEQSRHWLRNAKKNEWVMVKILIHMSGTIVVVIHISSCQEPICGQVWKSPSSTTTTMRVSWRKSVNFGDKLARTLNAAIADGGWIHLLDCNNNRSHPHGIQTINGLHLQNINNDFGKNSGGIIYQWSPPPLLLSSL